MKRLLFLIFVISTICQAQYKELRWYYKPSDSTYTTVPDFVTLPSADTIDTKVAYADSNSSLGWYRRGYVDALLNAKQNTISNLADTSKYFESIDSSGTSGWYRRGYVDALLNAKQNTITNLTDTSKYIEPMDTANATYGWYKRSYIDALLNAITGTGVITLNGLNGVTQTLAIDTTVTGVPAWSSATTVHTLQLPFPRFLKWTDTLSLVMPWELGAYSPIAGSSSITTLGTIVTGVWSGTSIDTNKTDAVSKLTSTNTFIVIGGGGKAADVKLDTSKAATSTTSGLMSYADKITQSKTTDSLTAFRAEMNAKMDSIEAHLAQIEALWDWLGANLDSLNGVAIGDYIVAGDSIPGGFLPFWWGGKYFQKEDSNTTANPITLSYAVEHFAPISVNGTVTSVSVVTANGISGSVATETTTPAITLTLGAITPTTVNGYTVRQGTSLSDTTKQMLKSDSSATAGEAGKYWTPTMQANATRHLRVTIIDPNTAYGKDSCICIWNKTDVAIVITNLEVSCGADPTTEPTGDIKYADAFIGRANPVVINDFDTTNGVRSDGSIASGNVASGKCIFIRFDAAPEAAMTQITFDISYHL
jgi:hypothetical protein